MPRVGILAVFKDPANQFTFEIPLGWGLDAERSLATSVLFRWWNRPNELLSVWTHASPVPPETSDDEWYEALQDRVPTPLLPVSRFDAPSGAAAASDVHGFPSGRHLRAMWMRGVRLDVLATHEVPEPSNRPRSSEAMERIANTIEVPANIASPVFVDEKEVREALRMADAAFEKRQPAQALEPAERARAGATSAFLYSLVQGAPVPELPAIEALAEAYIALGLSSESLVHLRSAELLVRRALASIDKLQVEGTSNEELRAELANVLDVTLELERAASGVDPASVSKPVTSLRAFAFRSQRLLQNAIQAQQAGDIQAALAMSSTALEDLLSLLANLPRPLSVPDHVAETLKGQEVIDPAEQADLWFRRAQKDYARGLLGALLLRQVLHTTLGDDRSAIETTQLMVDVAQFLRGTEQDRESMILLAESLIQQSGSLLFLQDEAVLEDAKRALERAESILNEASEEGELRAHWCLVEGWVRYELHQISGSLAILDRGLQAASSTPQNTKGITRALKTLKASFLIADGQIDEAGGLAEEVVADQSAGPAMAHHFLNLAAVQEALGRREEALEALRESLDRGLSDSPLTEDILRTLTAAGRLVGESDPPLRFLLTIAALSILDVRRELIGTEEHQVALDEGWLHRNVAGDLVTSLAAAGLLAEATAAADRSRARTLNQALGVRRRGAGALLNLLSAEPPPNLEDVPLPRALERGARYILSRTDSLLQSAGAPEPLDGDAIKALAGELGVPSVLVQPVDDAVALLVVSPSGEIIWRRSEASAKEILELAALAQDTLGIVTTTRGGEETDLTDVEDEDTGQTLSTALTSLWHALLEPVEDVVDRDAPLVISPYREFALVPYHLLTSPDGMPVIERRAISITPSLATLGLLRRRSGSGTTFPRRAFVAGNPLLDPQSGFDPLRRAEEEARAVRVALVKAGMRKKSVTLRLNEQATESAYRAEAQGCDLVHLSCHAALKRPAYASPLYFTVGEYDDGLLLPVEVARVKLDDALVFLAACQTALGRTTVDGIIGLGRAFFQAGARAVVMSLWRVADVTTEALSSHFYEALLHSHPPLDAAEALRSSMLETRDDLREGRILSSSGDPLPDHPALWGPFVIQGDPFGIRHGV